MIVKTCTVCLTEKDETHFNKHKGGKNGLNPVCKPCRITRQRKHRSENGYGSRIKYVYGITMADYENMKTKQENKCYICSTTFSETHKGGNTACIDHNHTTGKVRKLLCRNCNTAIGHAKEDINILKAMINYIEEH